MATAIMSKKANDQPQSLTWFWLLVVTQIFGLWPWIARYSKNLFFDGLLYDFIITLTFYGTFVALGIGKGFTVIQWLALAMVLAGLFVLKFGS